MRTTQIFENNCDSVTGNDVCLQCGAMYRSLKECDVIAAAVVARKGTNRNKHYGDDEMNSALIKKR